jgi:hypothetical protein
VIGSSASEPDDEDVVVGMVRCDSVEVMVSNEVRGVVEGRKGGCQKFGDGIGQLCACLSGLVGASRDMGRS